MRCSSSARDLHAAFAPTLPRVSVETQYSADFQQVPSAAYGNICSFTEMAYPAYLRERARELRVTKHLSIDELAERLALPKTTIYYWVKDLPLGRERRASAGQRKGNLAMQAKYRRLREEAYEQGAPSSANSYRSRPSAISSSCTSRRATSETAMRCRLVTRTSESWQWPPAGLLAYRSSRSSMRSNITPIKICTNCADSGVKRYRIDGATIRMQRKSNSGQLKGRSWRSRHGVLSVGVHDTLLRARLQAWIDAVRREWRLDSAGPCGA